MIIDGGLNSSTLSNFINSGAGSNGPAAGNNAYSGNGGQAAGMHDSNGGHLAQSQTNNDYMLSTMQQSAMYNQ